MTISPLDQKLLWGKAAGRCSMPTCRRVLVAASVNVTEGVLVGECCHIVAESQTGPRGTSALPKGARNKYSNLILLCAEHHTVIDKDWKSWSIEALHQIKSNHEVWVETQLTVASDSLADQVYSSLVNLATDSLRLAEWDGVSDHAIRSILPVWFVEGTDKFVEQVFKTNWPGAKPQLEHAIGNLSERLDQFVSHFMARAYLRHERFYAEDLRWKREVNDFEQRDKLAQQSI